MFINFEHYRIFYVVAKSGSITKGAGELFLSQPAVSQSIKQLETQIGGKLFVRTNKGMEMTYEGKVIYEYVKQANVLIETAEKKFTQLKALAVGEIRIGASDTITKYFLMDFLKVFVKKYPDIKIKIVNRTSGDTADLLRAGKLDIGFVTMPYSDDYLDISEWSPSKMIFVCDRARKYRIKKVLSAQELAESDLILLEKTSTARRSLDKFFAERGVTVVANMELCSYDLAIDLAKAGFGVACVPEITVQRELSEGELVEVETDFELPRTGVGLATLKGMPLNFCATTFVNLLEEGKR